MAHPLGDISTRVLSLVNVVIRLEYFFLNGRTCGEMDSESSFVLVLVLTELSSC